MGKIGLIFIFVSMTASLVAKGNEKDNLKQLAGKLAATKSQIATDDQTQREILGSLYSINKKMKAMSEKRNRLSNEALIQEAKVKRVARSIVEMEESIAEQRLGLSQRLRSLYILKGQSLMRILFGAQSGHEFDKNLKYLKLLTDRDYNLIKDYQQDLAELQVKRLDLKKRVTKLIQSQNQLKSQKSLLLSQQKSKSRILNKIRASKSQYMKELKRLRSRSKQIVKSSQIKELEAALRPSFFEEKGALRPPVDGAVLKGFGIEQDSSFGFQTTHKGIKFSVSPGETIRSIFHGQVAFEGFLVGYGPSVIIDHGDHYYSVYTNTTSTYVASGDKVITGQEIALGAPKASSRSTMYFEIRHFSEAIDPSDWLRVSEVSKSQL